MTVTAAAGGESEAAGARAAAVRQGKSQRDVHYKKKALHCMAIYEEIFPAIFVRRRWTHGCAGRGLL